MFFQCVLRSIVLLSIIIQVAFGYGTCPDPLVPCRNSSHCVAILEVCDKYDDCKNEDGHLVECHMCPENKDNSLHCLTYLNKHFAFSCLTKNERCNGIPNCLTGEDEASCEKKPCPPTHVLCEDGKCVSKLQKCHENVTEPTFSIPPINDSCSIQENNFRCSTPDYSSHRMCIPTRRLCDGFIDCPGEDDEVDCYDSCENNTCSRNMNCIEHPSQNKLCRCSQMGYHPVNKSSVSDNLICQDYNECEDNDYSYCSFGCLNTDGGYTCSCPDGFAFDQTTRSCQSKDNSDSSKPNLIVLFESSIRFFHITNVTHHRSTHLFNPIILQNNHHITHIQYDPDEHFILYYDSSQETLYCHSQSTKRSVALIMNIKINHFTYDAKRKNLFFIETLTNRLHIYNPITCNSSSSMETFFWSLKHLPQSIRSIQIDGLQGRIIFASEYEFFTAKFFKANSTRRVYTSDRPIQNFNYDMTFQRIFWTTSPMPNDNFSALYTCDGQFRQCHDTFVRLPVSWPFTFSNDALIYSLKSLKALKRIPLYGQHRFRSKHLTTSSENIRLLVPISHQINKSIDPCMENGREQCSTRQICIPSNLIQFTCLNSEGTVRPSYAESIHNVDPILPDPVATEPSNSKDKKRRLSKFFTLTIRFLLFGLILTIIIRIGKRIYQRRRQQTLARCLQQQEQRLTIEDPILDEFTIGTNDQHGDRLPLTNQLHY